MAMEQRPLPMELPRPAAGRERTGGTHGRANRDVLGMQVFQLRKEKKL